MTESEAISCLKADKEYLVDMKVCDGEEIDVAIKALEEVEQYRAIGTPEECRAAVEKQKAKKPEPIDYKKYMDSVKNAEFLRGAYWCPNCNHVVRSGDYCNDCGQKLDWGDVE